MKSLLDVLISKTQSVFVGSRLIQDNIIVGFEGINTMRKGMFGNELGGQGNELHLISFIFFSS